MDRQNYGTFSIEMEVLDLKIAWKVFGPYVSSNGQAGSSMFHILSLADNPVIMSIRAPTRSDDDMV